MKSRKVESSEGKRKSVKGRGRKKETGGKGEVHSSSKSSSMLIRNSRYYVYF